MHLLISRKPPKTGFPVGWLITVIMIWASQGGYGKSRSNPKAWILLSRFCYFGFQRSFFVVFFSSFSLLLSQLNHTLHWICTCSWCMFKEGQKMRWMAAPKNAVSESFDGLWRLCKPSSVCGWQFSRGSPVFAPPNDWLVKTSRNERKWQGRRWKEMQIDLFVRIKSSGRGRNIKLYHECTGPTVNNNL